MTDWPERLVVGAELFVEGATEPTRIVEVERGGRALVVRLDGIDTRELAEALVGRYLETIPKPLPEGSWYWDDLIGLTVVEAGGAEVGELVEIFRAGGGEVYRVVGPSGERLVPALRSVVLEVDLAEGRMVIAPDDSVEVR